MPLCIAIDPGVRTAGYAVFSDGHVVRAGYIIAKDRRELGYMLLSEAFLEHGRAKRAIIERPTIYDSRHQKGDQKDIADLLLTVGYLAATLEASDCDLTVEMVEPRSWKGQIPKEVSQLRVDRILTEEERLAIRWPTAKSLRHNCWDALHLGVWAFARHREKP